MSLENYIRISINFQILDGIEEIYSVLILKLKKINI